MADHSIYRDIAERTGGDIYIGVVGPVRSGKSTFIKRFMESLVLPNIGEGYLPQLQESASIREDGTIISTIVNTSMMESAEVDCQIADFQVKDIVAEVLMGEAHDHNTFEIGRAHV